MKAKEDLSPMTSEAQITANRINAQSSTGPSSPAGRKKSSMNALKHNFCGQTCIIPDHEIEDYGRHFESFRKEFRPVGPSEEFMVQSLSELSWSTQQIRAAMASKISLGGNRHDPPAKPRNAKKWPWPPPSAKTTWKPANPANQPGIPKKMASFIPSPNSTTSSPKTSASTA